MLDGEEANANQGHPEMANAMVGKLTAFDSQSQTWEEYVEVLGHFFIANGIVGEEKKRAILLSSVGSWTYSL